MRKRFLALFMVVLVGLLPACGNTAEGLQEDVNNNVDEAQQEVEEEDNDDG